MGNFFKIWNGLYGKTLGGFHEKGILFFEKNFEKTFSGNREIKMVYKKNPFGKPGGFLIIF